MRPGPISFYWNLILFPFTQCSALKAVGYSALLGMAQAAQVFGYLRQISTG